MKNQKDSMKKPDFCPWCGQQTMIIWVHGHGQCANCGINIDECCRGEICEIPDVKNIEKNKSE